MLHLFIDAMPQRRVIMPTLFIAPAPTTALTESDGKLNDLNLFAFSSLTSLPKHWSLRPLVNFVCLCCYSA